MARRSAARFDPWRRSCYAEQCSSQRRRRRRTLSSHGEKKERREGVKKPGLFHSARPQRSAAPSAVEIPSIIFCRKGKPAILSRLNGAVWAVAIALLSATLALWIVWRIPGLEMSSRDWLMRQRGLLQPPDDIVIVAIDESSLK